MRGFVVTVRCQLKNPLPGLYASVVQSGCIVLWVEISYCKLFKLDVKAQLLG